MNAIVQHNVTDTLTIARTLLESGFLPNSIKTAQQAFAIITLGQELGVPAWTALNGINVIQGKPTASPQLMLGLINRSGLLEDMQIEEGDDYCSVTLKRRGRAAYTFTFTDADAQAMGLLNKDNWRKMRATMRRWRAISGAERIVFPDIIIGLYPPEEIAPDLAVNEDGALIVAPTSTVMAAVPPAPPAVQNPSGLDKFLARNGAAPASVDPSPCWGKAQATAFVRKWEASDGLSSTGILEILGIARFGEWCDGEDAADRKIRAALGAPPDEPSVDAILAEMEQAEKEKDIPDGDRWPDAQIAAWTARQHRENNLSYKDLCIALGVRDLRDVRVTEDVADEMAADWARENRSDAYPQQEDDSQAIYEAGRENA